MARRIIEAAGRTYTFSPDDAVPLSGRMWAIVRAFVIDEITGDETTGKPPRNPVTILADRARLIPRVANNGLVGLIGIPGQIFPALATQNYPIHLTVQAGGYIPLHEERTIASVAGFPHAFAPTDIGTLFLHREPIAIRGRVMLASGNMTTPVPPGATVRVTGIWRTLADLDSSAEPPNLVSLQPPLYFPRAAATGRLRRREMPPVVGEDKRLLDAVRTGDNLFRLSDRVNLTMGDIILIDATNPDLLEYLPIDSVLGVSTPDQPATIRLTYPLLNPHRSDAVVRRAIPQVAGPDNPFNRDAIFGETCVFLSSMNNVNVANVVEIFGGSNPAEYHRLSRFTVTSDADGYFRLPPLSRVAQVEINADDGAHAPITHVFSPDYTHRENRVDFTFS